MTPDLALALGTAGLAASMGTGFVFLAAGVAKLRHRAVLPGVIANYRLLPRALVAPVAAVLPLVEVAVGAMMLFGYPPAALAGAALLLAFAAAMAINIGRGRSHIDCGCGHPQLRQPLTRTHVARNIVLAALSLAIVFVPAPAGAAATATAVAGGISLYLLVLLLDTIGALGSSPLVAASRR